jgi:RNA polymerase sigma factor (sigma-70 family)
MIHRAADGSVTAGNGFAERYMKVVRTALGARWNGRPNLLQDVDDAAQEVMVDCLKMNGALGRADSQAKGGFRAYLYGITQRTALKFETKAARRFRRESPGSFHPDQVAADDTTLGSALDRSLAKAVMQGAFDLYDQRAADQDEDYGRRVELLRLRFYDGLPIRDIADRWQEPREKVHRTRVRALREFKDCLRELLGLQEGCAGETLDAELARLLDQLRPAS